MRDTAHKIVHSPGSGVILLGILKSVEQELLMREFVGDPEQQATPLWFIAETERNVFLWRSGKSLDERSEFIFWVDIPALICKRRAQLERNRGFNPFIQSKIGPQSHDEQATQTEKLYLERIEDMISTIFVHAEALSHASESIRLELVPNSSRRAAVTLPATPPQAGLPRSKE